MKGLKQIQVLAFMAMFACLSMQILWSQEMSKDELNAEAQGYFYSNNFQKAVAVYSYMVSLYPKDPYYNYYLGRSYLASNTGLEESISCLKIAASKNYTPDVHYYLATALYRNYQFEEAEISLINFINLSKKKLQKELRVVELQASIEKAREELYMVENIKVVSSDNISSYQVDGVYSSHVGGKFIQKHQAFMSSSDHDNNYQGIMYQPISPENGYLYYVSSYGKGGKEKKDIYEIKQVTALDYSLPRRLENVNTEYNEEFPYFDKEKQMLFFSSDRIGGLGGYDIYYSEYNSETNVFAEPKRMEFPINSSYDDLLYVPDSANKRAIFLSNRTDEIGKYTAYKIELSEELDYILPESTAEIKQIAALEVTQPSVAPAVVEQILPVAEVKTFTQYDLLLQQAMNKQLKCDSMQAILLSKKNTLRVTDDIDDRRVLIACISELENNISEDQNLADALFVQARKVNNEEEAVEEETGNEHLVLDKDIDGMKVFSYLPSEQYYELGQEEEFTVGESMVNKEELEMSDRFAILGESPYDDLQPIPTDENIPDGLVYRIQLGAFGKSLPMNTFGGLSPVSAEIIEERNLTKYYVGYFASSKEAHSALDEVKEYGFGDAFVVPYYDRSKISINAAREIEFGEKTNIR